MSKTERCKCDPSVRDLSSVRGQVAAVPSVELSTQQYQPCFFFYSKITFTFITTSKPFKAE
jgi:hypothetical protein